MKKSEVTLGKVYAVKVSGKIVPVRLDSESPYGGWNGTNLNTKREVRIRSAAKLRREYAKPKSNLDFNVHYPNIAKVKDLFDVRILADLGEDKGCRVTDPMRNRVYSLGQRPDLSAGYVGFVMTPFFPDLTELESFCKRHVPEDAPAPDATGWE